MRNLLFVCIVAFALSVLPASWTHGQIGPVTGCVEWSYDFPAPVYAPPAISPFGTIFVPAENSILYVLNPNGTLRGSFPSPGTAAFSPSTFSSDSTLYFGNSSGTLWSVAPSGQINWTKSLDGAIAAAPTMSTLGTVIVTTLNGSIYAYHANGTLDWQYSPAQIELRTGSIMASASIGLDGSIYVVDLYSPKVVALDPDSGIPRWIADLTAAFDPDNSNAGRNHHGFVIPPTVGLDGTVYVIPTYSKTLVALHPSSGQVRWQRELNESRDAGLAAYWKFDTSSWTTVKDNQGLHDGTLRGEMSRDANRAAGRIGNCFSFDGVEEYIEIPDYKGITGPGSRTCAAWVRTSAAAVGTILSWGDEQDGGEWMFRIEADGTLTLQVGGGYVSTTVAVNDGQWHHVATVLNSDGAPSLEDVTLYVDGAVQNTDVNNTQAINTVAGQNVMIGAFDYLGGIGSLFNGLIDEVRIYDRALGAEEIRPLAMPEDFLVTRYGDSACWSPPVVGPDGILYISFDHPYLFAVNSDGTVKWCRRLGMTGGFTLAVDDQNKIYAASEDGTLYVLAPDGSLRSTYRTDGPLANPVLLSGGRLLITDQRGSLRQLGTGTCDESVELTYPADLTLDEQVNLRDFIALSQSWLAENDFSLRPENTFTLDRIDFQMLPSDLNGDFYVDLDDLALIMERWLSAEAL